MTQKSSLRYRPEPQDFVMAVISVVFATASTVWPDARVLASGFPRGYAMALFFAAIAVVACLAGFAAPSSERSGYSFVRLFYPQLALLPFFSESILISSRAFGGRSYDAVFAAADQWIFGFQPSREFFAAFGHVSWFNELMFGSYFVYFVLLIGTPWLAYLARRRDEARRQLFVALAAMTCLSTFYIFFRVQGPKYYFEDLRNAWYDGIEGGVFVAFFKTVFSVTVLSGAAFPSTHVALASVSVAGAARIDKRLIPPYVVAAILIIASTVYIYAHYAVDALGGLAYAFVALPLLHRAYPRVEGLCSAIAAAAGDAATARSARLFGGSGRRVPALRGAARRDEHRDERHGARDDART
ncbi:MAG: phosphatase PAP2 family protein [Spirochaetaceae bacterium]|nr:phosphatase PAP2 family protein [Spirochaetaceae bacterium]